jgi:membrane protein
MDGLNVAYGETEKRSFVHLNLVALAFTLGAILASMIALSWSGRSDRSSHLGLGGGLDALIRIARWPALMALVVLGYSGFRRFSLGSTGPSEPNSDSSLKATCRRS